MSPVGLGWDEITASSLIKADIHYNILSDTALSLAKSGQSFHTEIQKERKDFKMCLSYPPSLWSNCFSHDKRVKIL